MGQPNGARGLQSRGRGGKHLAGQLGNEVTPKSHVRLDKVTGFKDETLPFQAPVSGTQNVHICGNALKGEHSRPPPQFLTHIYVINFSFLKSNTLKLQPCS